MLLKLTSNVSIDGVEHKAGEIIDPIKKGISAECLLTWRWAEEIDELKTDKEVETLQQTETIESVEQPVEPIAPPVEPPAPKPPRKSRK